jgi:hypothetical protein
MIQVSFSPDDDEDIKKSRRSKYFLQFRHSACLGLSLPENRPLQS